MKKQLKSLVIIVLGAMLTTVANAQTANEPAKLTAEECQGVINILKSTPAAKMGMTAQDSTLFVRLASNNNAPLEFDVAEDGKLCGTQVKKGDGVRIFIVRTSTGFNLFADVVRQAPKKVVEDRSQIQSLDTARVNTQFVTRQRTGKPQYGIDYHYEAAGGTQGDVHKDRQDKYGVSVKVGADYNLGGDVTSFGGRVGLAYSVSDKLGKWSLKGEVDGILRRTRFNENAEQSGEPYTAYATELRGLLGYAFGTHGEWRVLAGPMGGWEFYRTDSRETVNEDGSRQLLKSWGNFFYFGGVARVEYDWANGPVGFFGEGGYRLHKSVLQNEDMLKQWIWTFSIGINVKLWRHQSRF